MPKGKGRGRRGAGETKAERALRRAIARELPAIKAVAECCDGFRDEWRKAKEHPGKEFIRNIDDRTDEEAVELWKRVVMGRDGVEMLILGIELGRCAESLVALPETIGDFACLRALGLRSCRKLLALPDTIGKLGVLRELDLDKCSSLAALPDSIGKLDALTELNLSGCSSLAALPAAIGDGRRRRHPVPHVRLRRPPLLRQGLPDPGLDRRHRHLGTPLGDMRVGLPLLRRVNHTVVVLQPEPPRRPRVLLII